MNGDWRPRADDEGQGDPMRAIQAKKMLEVIKSHNLVEHTKATGDALYARLETLAKAQPKMRNLRGKNNGTFIAWDFETPQERDAFVGRMRVNGVQMGGCGDKSVSSLTPVGRLRAQGCDRSDSGRR